MTICQVVDAPKLHPMIANDSKRIIQRAARKPNKMTPKVHLKAQSLSAKLVLKRLRNAMQGSADCAKRLESARAMLAEELRRARSETQFVLAFDPLKSPKYFRAVRFTLLPVVPCCSGLLFTPFSETRKSQQN